MSDSTAAELTAIEAARATAIVDRDIAALEALTADDYVHVETSGILRDKPAFLDALRNGTRRFSRYETSDLVVQRYGDVALVRGILENRPVTDQGEGPTKRARFQRVYVLVDGDWRNVSHFAAEITAALP